MLENNINVESFNDSFFRNYRGNINCIGYIKSWIINANSVRGKSCLSDAGYLIGAALLDRYVPAGFYAQIECARRCCDVKRYAVLFGKDT